MLNIDLSIFYHLQNYLVITENVIQSKNNLSTSQRKGRKDSNFRICYDIDAKAKEIYFGGTHSDLKSLSINGRPAGRNNQALEGIHTGTINMGACDANNSAKGSVERFINTVKMEEINFTTRQYQIKNLKGKPKSKRPVAIAKDKAIATIVKQHAEGKITTNELLQKYILRTAEHSLPRELRHLQY